MPRIFLCLLLITSVAIQARCDDLPKPRLPRLCQETGHCTCVPGHCTCPMCRLSAQNQDLVKQVDYLKSRIVKYKAALEELQRIKADLQSLKARSTPFAPVTYYYHSAPHQSPVTYCPPISYRIAPAMTAPVQGLCST